MHCKHSLYYRNRASHKTHTALFEPAYSIILKSQKKQEVIRNKKEEDPGQTSEKTKMKSKNMVTDNQNDRDR